MSTSKHQPRDQSARHSAATALNSATTTVIVVLTPLHSPLSFIKGAHSCQGRASHETGARKLRNAIQGSRPESTPGVPKERRRSSTAGRASLVASQLLCSPLANLASFKIKQSWILIYTRPGRVPARASLAIHARYVFA